MKKWECKTIEREYAAVSQEHYQQLIAELAELLYVEFSQPIRSKFADPEKEIAKATGEGEQ